jgi:protein disulfide-isomerase A6
MGVQGFPTLKVVRPSKKPGGKPIVEDYQGPRTAKAIVDHVVDRIPNHVTKLTDENYQDFLDNTEFPMAILFTTLVQPSAMLKAIAIDFLGKIPIAQIREKEKEAKQVFMIEKYPTLVLLRGEPHNPYFYDGPMKKDDIVKWLSQAAQPNPDPAPKAKKEKDSKKSDKKASKASSSFSKASASHASEEAQTNAASQTMEDLEADSNPTESPNPRVDDPAQKPIQVPDVAPPIQSLHDGLSLQQKCLNTKAGTCILALLPDGDPTANSLSAIISLSEIHHKHEAGGRHLFPFYQLPNSNSQATALRSKLNLGTDVELIAVNGKRSWCRHYPKDTFTQVEIEDWIDAIRMGDLPKESLPDGLVVPEEHLPAEPVKIDFSNPEELKNAMKGQLPEGVEFEMEEVDDAEYERLMAQGRAAAAAKDQKEEKEEPAAKKVEEHDEL